MFESVAFIAWHLARAVGSDQPIVGVALFLACTTTVWAFRRSTGARSRELALVALAALLLSILAARGIVGERYDYLMRYLFGVIPVLLAVAIASIFMRFVPRKVAVVLLLGVAMFSLPPPLRRESKPCLVNARKLAELLVPQHGVRYRIAVPDPKDWPLLSAMALVFQRNGIPVCVDQQWAATFDWSFTCTAQSAGEGFPPRPLRTIMLYNTPPLTPPTLPHVVRRKGFVMAWE